MMNHRNDERTVRCPVEGCDATPLARGINLHLNRSSGDGHGPRGEVPDHISTDDLETVGSESVEMDYPEERENEKHARLCPYCNQTFAGVQGLTIHLGQTAGRKNHPEDPSALHEPSDFPRVEVDAEGNVLAAVDSTETAPTESRDNAVVPTTRVFRLIAELTADGEARAAHRVRRALLGADAAVSGDVESAHPDLFDALVSFTRTNLTDQCVTAAVENGGVMVSYRDESAFLSAGEARNLAERLTQLQKDEQLRNADIVHLVGFLQHGADLLEQDETVHGLHEEFDQWR